MSLYINHYRIYLNTTVLTLSFFLLIVCLETKVFNVYTTVKREM